jgi:hypothetical protein
MPTNERGQGPLMRFAKPCRRSEQPHVQPMRPASRQRAWLYAATAAQNL